MLKPYRDHIPLLKQRGLGPPLLLQSREDFPKTPEAQELRPWSLSCVNAYRSHLFTRSDIPYTLLVFIQANPFLHETLLSWKASSFTRSCGKAVVGLASRSWEGMNLMSFCRSRAWSWMVLPHWTARWKQVEKPRGPRISCAVRLPPSPRMRENSITIAWLYKCFFKTLWVCKISPLEKCGPW